MFKHTCFKKGSFNKVWKKLAISMIAGLATIGTGVAKEDTKMIAEDVIEEHNGVYGGKWHIVSPEGFDLPEGLEYLKEMCMKCAPKDPSLKCSSMSFKDIAQGLKFLEEKQENFRLSDLEIAHCFRWGDVCSCFESIMQLDMDNFTVHGCTLTFKDLRIIIENLRSLDQLNLSENSFMFCEEDWFNVEKLGMNLNRYNISRLDMTKSNFSEDEKIRLSTLIKIGNRLIL